MKKTQGNPTRPRPPSRKKQAPAVKVIHAGKSQPKNRIQAPPTSLPIQPLPIAVKEKKVQPSIIEMINTLLALDVQHQSFEQLWATFTTTVDGLIKFKAMQPQPVTPLGQQLLSNGLFLVAMLKIMRVNPYLNFQNFLKSVREKYLGNVTKYKGLLSVYLLKCGIPLIPKKRQTPPKTKLKRSILKTKTKPSASAKKKVIFKPDQIIYPRLEEYKEIKLTDVMTNSLSNNRDRGRSRQEQVRQNHGFILDYFEINQIFFQHQVEFIGVLRQYENKYAVVLAKNKSTGEDKACIVVTKEGIVDKNETRIFIQIERQYENLCYLETESKSSADLLLNSLPEDKLT